VTRYIVAAIKPWNADAYHRHVAAWSGDWELVDSPEQLLDRVLVAPTPRYVFFPHWSWKVPDEILGATECVCFHMTDVPYGRGGSPLQNLIVRGHETTSLSALRMTEVLDAGPVYQKAPLALNGGAHEIFEHAADIAFRMIGDIARDEPVPTPQEGTVTLFDRRTPDQSVLPQDESPTQIYDHIRMLDADTYPAAFLDHGTYHLEFRDAALDGETVTASVTIRRRVRD
jgi:methionyl-tRNA formyltransferase